MAPARAKSRRPRSGSATSSRRSTAAAIPSSASSARRSSSPRRSSATATTCSARAIRYRAPARAAGARRRSSRSATTAGAARSPSTRRAAGRSPSRRGSTASRRGSDEVTRKLEGGQTDLAGELSEGRALLGADVSLEEALAVDERATGTARSSSTSKLGVDVDRSSRASARGTSSSRARGAASRASRRCCRSSPSSASTSSTCRRSTRSGTRTARAATTRSRRSPATSAARGRSAPRRAATRRSIPTSARSPTSSGSSTRARELGIEIALDFAIQCSPDHPWLKEHPEWFHRRPDGTLKYAENPPKKYQDIYNVNFESEDWRGLWEALRDVMLHWVAHGVRVFRVDNPHTKPVPFWEWLIARGAAASSRSSCSSPRRSRGRR